MGALKNRTFEQILSDMVDIISDFNENYKKYTSEEVREKRTELSILNFSLAEGPMLKFNLEKVSKEVTVDRQEKVRYTHWYDVCKKQGISNSQSEDKARKLQKGDKIYLEHKEAYLTCKANYENTMRVVKATEQVLHAMSSY